MGAINVAVMKAAEKQSAQAKSPQRDRIEAHLDGMVNIGQVTLSPNGSHVAFSASRLDLEANLYRRQIWIVPSDGSAPAMPITSGDPGESDPAWSPDGRYLAFVSRRDSSAPGSTATFTKGAAGATLHVIPISAPGEIRRIALRPDAISTPQWSPDGRWIAFAARVPHERYSADDERGQQARQIETFFTQLNGEGWVYDRRNHLFVVAADGTDTPRDLTPAVDGAVDAEHNDFAWFPDSSQLVVAAARHSDWDRDYATDLHLVTLAGEITTLTSGGASLHHPSPSPDGTKIAFLGMDDPRTYPQNLRVGVLDLARQIRTWISEDLDRTFGPTSGPLRPVWDGNSHLFASAEDRGTCHLYRLDPTGAIAPTPMTTGQQWISHWDRMAGVTVAVTSTVDRPGEVVLLDSTGHVAGALTQLNSAFLARATPVGWHRFLVPVSQPTPGITPEIDAWIMFPPGVDPIDPDANVPVILNVHGGPHTQYGETYFDEAQVQAAAGFAVIMSNPRGSSGREEAWGQAIIGPKHPRRPGTGWGVADLADVLDVLDAALRTFPACDATRVGMQGGSYGGFMASLLAARHGGRLKAVCSERAVNNLLTLEWSSDIGSRFQSWHGPNPVDDPEEYWRMSPMSLATDIDIPVLIIHSERDLRCPMGQAEEMFMSLRMMDKPVEFWRFPAETHELSRAGSPVHRRQRFEIILDWFTRHLGTPN
jgi:dipeptidyl aminopeptidase/acylaminoacyl peptidase